MNLPMRNRPILLALGAASLLGAMSTTASANPRLGIGEIRRTPIWVEMCGAYTCSCFNELTGTAGPPSVHKRCFIQSPYPAPNIPPQHSIPGTTSLPPGSLNGTPLVPVSPGTTAPDGQGNSQSHFQPQPPPVVPTTPNSNGPAATNNALSATPAIPTAPRFTVPNGQAFHLNPYQPRPPQVAPRVPNGNGIVTPNNTLNRTALPSTTLRSFTPNPAASQSQPRLRQVAPSATNANRLATVRPSASFASKPNLAAQRMTATSRLAATTTTRTAGSMRLSSRPVR